MCVCSGGCWCVCVVVGVGVCVVVGVGVCVCVVCHLCVLHCTLLNSLCTVNDCPLLDW